MTEAGRTFGGPRGMIAALLGIALISGAIAGAVAFGATKDSGEAASGYASPTVAAAYTEPPSASAATPTPLITADLPETLAVPSETQTPTAVASAIATDPAGPTVTSSVSATPTLGDAWSATPVKVTPAPGYLLTTSAAALAAEIESKWGIDVVTAGQDWGRDGPTQLRNLGALAGALEMLPVDIVALATHNAHGTLAVLSNGGGRTLSGWQPYGDRAANFYTTEDWTGSARHDSSQVVLQSGADRMTIAHELLHAYQMRNVPAGSYGLSLLTPEMQSFMDATGWVQAVPDSALESSLHGPWDQIAELFDYEGRDLAYVSGSGSTVEAYTPNPIEAFAVVGALYYATPDGTDLPDWPEYWAWLAANLG